MHMSINRQVISCFGLSEMTRQYVGYATCALLVEVNSVFLHLRQLLIIQGFSRLNSTYRLNSLFNIGTNVFPTSPYIIKDRLNIEFINLLSWKCRNIFGVSNHNVALDDPLVGGTSRHGSTLRLHSWQHR